MAQSGKVFFFSPPAKREFKGCFAEDFTEVKNEDTATVLGVPKVELQNGKYECNHSCKDKTQCRHFCCRDGLSEAPNGSRKRHTDMVETKNASKITRLHATRTNVSTRRNDPKNDPKTKKLESMHDGSRLKLDSSPHSLRRKRRAAPNFDISFTDLKGPESSDRGLLFEANLDDDDDNDLPEGIFPVLSNKATPKTDYSNSAVDDLVCTPPENTSKKTGPECCETSPVSPANVSLTRPSKKRKVDNEVMTDDQELTALFCQTSEQDQPGHFEDSVVSVESPRKPQLTPMKPIPDSLKDGACQTRLVLDVHSPGGGDSNDDEFTELDAWLQSGSVRIV